MKIFKPMGLIVAEPFDSENYIFELKFDGMRVFAHLGENTILINRNGHDITEKYPELVELHKSVATPCVLDGEVIAVQNGKPSFSKLQNRLQLSDKIRIKSIAKSQPVQYIAFDILQINGAETTSESLMIRKKFLQEVINQSQLIIISQFVEKNGIQLFNIAKEQGFEGIVAKRKDSLYIEGSKNQDWQKIKVVHDEDFVIDDYKIDESTGKVCSIHFKYAEWRNFNLSRFASDAIIKYFDNPKGELVCTIEYLEKTEDGKMRIPVFKGIRID